MVVTPERHATAVGAAVLRDGGNAIDAAVAVAAALTVTYPVAGNLLGGGFLLYVDPDGNAYALDHREVSPRALTPDHFRDASGKIDPRRSREGGLAVGVPGSAAGLEAMHRRWGTRPFRALVRPAVRLARQGFPISRRAAAEIEKRLEALAADPEARAIFTRDGRAPEPGDRLVQRDLARTLRRYGREGAAAIHTGEIARAIADTVTAYGGVLTVDDLASYRPVSRDPLRGTYRGHDLVTFPPPSSGGVALLQILAMLEPLDLTDSGPGSSRTLHRMIEAERRAYADRASWLGDPDAFAVPVEALLDPDYLRARAASIREDRATPSEEISAGVFEGIESPDTLHVSIVDRHGGAVALTTTLNSAFGAAIVARGTGLLLNNEIDDFALAPGVPNQFGLLGGRANAVSGGKRPLSSMTPTIVLRDGRPVLVVGSPGGSTIITTVLQIVVNVLEHGMELQEAVDAPRIHHQYLPDVVFHERRGLTEDVRRALEARGHTLRLRTRPIGVVAAIALDPETGEWLGAADPRDDGTAEAP